MNSKGVKINDLLECPVCIETILHQYFNVTTDLLFAKIVIHNWRLVRFAEMPIFMIHQWQLEIWNLRKSSKDCANGFKSSEDQRSPRMSCLYRDNYFCTNTYFNVTSTILFAKIVIQNWRLVRFAEMPISMIHQWQLEIRNWRKCSKDFSCLIWKRLKWRRRASKLT